MVALRKESVDRNLCHFELKKRTTIVALRKESVDRNSIATSKSHIRTRSLSARRAWIEILKRPLRASSDGVALRKESVDRNYSIKISTAEPKPSLSARRAWIEIH